MRGDVDLISTLSFESPSDKVKAEDEYQTFFPFRALVVVEPAMGSTQKTSSRHHQFTAQAFRVHLVASSVYRCNSRMVSNYSLSSYKCNNLSVDFAGGESRR